MQILGKIYAALPENDVKRVEMTIQNGEHEFNLFSKIIIKTNTKPNTRLQMSKFVFIFSLKIIWC